MSSSHPDNVTSLISFVGNHSRLWYSSSMSLASVMHSDPEILGGTPVFVGTRVPVQSLFDHLKAGDSIEDFLEGFPSVKREQVLSVIEASRQQILQPA